MKQRRMTVMELATRKTGSLRKGIKVAEFVLWWHLMEADTGRSDFTMDELADVAGLSRAQTFRYQSEFRAAFPGIANPGELLAGNPAMRKWAAGVVQLGERARAKEIASGVFLEIGAVE